MKSDKASNLKSSEKLISKGWIPGACYGKVKEHRASGSTPKELISPLWGEQPWSLSSSAT